MDERELKSLHWLDYVVFIAMLLISLGIGVYQAVTGGKQRTTGEYLMGDRSMSCLPVTISLVVSYNSAVTLLGFPAEIYAYGAQFFWTCVGCVIGGVGATYLFVPVLYPLKITSVNEYLMLRYQSRFVLGMASFFTISLYVFWVGNIIYMPAAAVESVTGFPTWISILITSAVAIGYSSIGGFKAVIWTDVFQAFIMFAGMLMVLVQSVIKVGGMGRVWELAGQWERLTFVDFDPSPYKRLNVYGAVAGTALTYLAIYGYQQMGFQRYSSMSNITKARRVTLGFIPGAVLLKIISCTCGLTVFAYYAMLGCDPKMGGHITSYNQVVTFFVYDSMPIAGLTGLFIAAIYAASLSSASSALNSAAACAWRDVLKQFLPGISEWKAATITKILTFGFGIIGLIFAFAIQTAGGTILQILYTFGAATGGPLAALYFMGVLVPWVNWKGTCIGCAAGMLFGLWVSLGSYLSGINWSPLPAPEASCNMHDLVWNLTTIVPESSFDTFSTEHAIQYEKWPTGLDRLYSGISFAWMREAVCGVTIAVSIIASGVFGKTEPLFLVDSFD